MRATEFETTAQHQVIQFQPGVSDGVNLRVLVFCSKGVSSLKFCFIDSLG